MSHYPPAAVSRPAGAFTQPRVPGVFQPGTKVQVGNHRVVVEAFFAEGGFAHVYRVRYEAAGGKQETAVLKRVAVPDKEALANMRTEVETMKKLKGHRKIVTYIDSHASQLKDSSGYEVFLLMEYCQGGGLIDFMNTRLQHRLTEPEILKIFGDVAEGVACMHYLKPPLLHRDLKVENVLISYAGSSKVYKLCDFGSASPPRPAASNAAEGRLIEDDIQRHTTMQYRSPEMIDVYRRQPIDEKSDIWALGVLLYKLCYYTTPFEEQGQMAILNATYKFPHYPSFSERLKALIGSMLRENPQKRPNIYQVLREVCSMRSTECPIKDIYSSRTASEARNNQQLPSPEPPSASPPMIGLSKEAPVQQVQTLPEITPMRRGRPTAPAPKHTPRTSPSPMKRAGPGGDPFAALDSANPSVRGAAADELASRFPSLDEFSLLHDRGGKFNFSQQSPAEPKQEPANKRVTEALADEVFAARSPQNVDQSATSKASVAASAAASAAASKNETIRPAQKPTAREEPRRPQSQIYQPKPQRSTMVSTGTMTSPPSSPSPELLKYPDVGSRPIHRFPPPGTQSPFQKGFGPQKPGEEPRNVTSSSSLKPELKRPTYLEAHRSKSQTHALPLPQSPASSRPSLEGSRPSALDINLNDPISRSKSANSRARPTSLHVESSIEFLRDREASRNRVGNLIDTEPDLNRVKSAPSADEYEQENNIASNVDFLRAMEDDGDHSKRKDKSHRRSGSNASKHSKRSSFPSLSNTKSILAGKFGDAFRRFEGGNDSRPSSQDYEPPSPQYERSSQQYERAGRMETSLTTIAGSVATGERSDDETAIDETQDLPPEVRRELERRRLSAEEKRVAEAAAEYRKRLAEQGETGRGRSSSSGGGPSKASTIQDRVKSLLHDSQATSPQRTASGYGRFTDKEGDGRPGEKPGVGKKPVTLPQGAPVQELTYGRVRPSQQPVERPPTSGGTAAATGPGVGRQPTGQRPTAPPKPRALRTGGQCDELPPLASKPAALAGRPIQEGAPAGFGDGSELGNVVLNADPDEWEERFTKRYPSLSGLEMVETEVPSGRSR
ncbi:uncharacterized protein IWZ02DRAFT_280245 [Phyllosticta citriasiana]|uniref:uncharacterized protein n=1 Tax=Phyllosticta citriasiana TaxID=595635 RepID=UPI0030FD87CF